MLLYFFKYLNLFIKINHLTFFFSVIRLIQQYLKESNLMKSLQTLQVPNYYFPCIILF